jgi:hypothetical protein
MLVYTINISFWASEQQKNPVYTEESRLAAGLSAPVESVVGSGENRKWE